MRKHVITLVAARGVSGLAQAVSLILLARWVPVETFGTLSAWAGVFLVVTGIFDLGLSGFLLVRRAMNDDSSVSTAVSINRWSSFVAAIVLGGLIGWMYTGNLMAALGTLAVAAALEKNTDTLLSIALADGRVALAGGSLLLRRVGTLCVFVVLAGFTMDPLLAYAIATLATGVVAQVQIYAYVRRTVSKSGAKVRWRGVFSESSKFMAQFVSGQARTLDSSVVAVFAGPTAAGLYGAATRLSAPLLLVPGAINSVLTPASARRNRVAAVASARRVIIVSAALAVVVGGLAPLAPFIVVVLLGADYAAAATSFALSLPAMVFIGFTSPIAGILQAQGHAKYVAVASVCSVIGLLGLAAVGAAVSGASGASVGLLLGSLIAWSIVSIRAATLPDLREPEHG